MPCHCVVSELHVEVNTFRVSLGFKFFRVWFQGFLLTCRVVICERASAAVRKTSSEMARARVSTAANPTAGNTYALFACAHDTALHLDLYPSHLTSGTQKQGHIRHMQRPALGPMRCTTLSGAHADKFSKGARKEQGKTSCSPAQRGGWRRRAR